MENNHIGQMPERTQNELAAEIEEMGNLIEGKWHQFEFRLTRSSDYQDILEHLKENFYREDSVSQVLGYSSENSTTFDQKIISYLAQNLSFLAIDSETGQIAGIRIMYESCQDEYSSCPSICFEKNRIFQFLAELEDKCHIFSMFSVTRCAMLLLTSICHEFRGQGLGTEMYRRSIQLLREKDFSMVKGPFCSPETIKIAEKLGFHELARSYIMDYRDQNGDAVFPQAEFEYVALMALKL